jgi:hypothetical protein
MNQPMKKLLSFAVLFVIVFAVVLGAGAGAARAAIGPWIDAHPKIAYSIKWEIKRDNYPNSYDQKESAKVSWPDWSAAHKQALEDAFASAQTWLHAADPLHNLNETIQYPPTNIDSNVGNDNGAPWVTVSADYAWDMYVRWVAHTLLLETEGALPWSILDYDTEMLKVLLDSASMFARIDDTRFTMATGSPGHPNYVRRVGNLGQSLPAPPRYVYAFLRKSGLIGADRAATIVNLLDWSSANMAHFTGDSTYANFQAHWGFRGAPPITRIIEGTIAEGEPTPRHWTAGCHGTTGFWRNVLRAANIPVAIANRCGHSLAYFLSEGRYVDHGDDPYNGDFKSLMASTSKLLIDVSTEEDWFGDNPNDNTDFCDGPNQSGAVERQIGVLKGRIEICNDGVDNDGDGAIDCADSDCPARALTQPVKLTAVDSRDQLLFGVDIAVSGGKLLVGAQGTDDRASARGAAYVMAYQNGLGWIQEAKLSPSNPADANFFGSMLALDGDTALVGGADEEGAFVGAAYLFSKKGNGAWTQDALLTPSDAHAGERFGSAAALQAGTAVVGAFEDNGLAGSAYVFTKSGSTWQATQKLTAGDASSGDLFGSSASLDGDVLVLGAIGTAQTGRNTGAAYVFRRTAGVWGQEAKLVASDGVMLAWFGWSVAVSGNRILVGATGDFALSGAAYVFDYDAASHTWTQSAKLTSPAAFDPINPGGFGNSVSLKGDSAVVGAYGEDQATGAAYLFQRGGGAWSLARTLKPVNGILKDRFGGAVRTDGSSVFVGAYSDGNQGYSTGAIYAYDLGASSRGQCINLDATQTGGSGVSLTFTSVARAGTTTVTASATAPPLPAGFQVGTPPTYYNVSTTADFAAPVRVCIDYSGVSYQNESAVKLLHYENGAWADLCATATGCTQDLARHVICGFAPSLSPFAVAELLLFPKVQVPPGTQAANAIFLAQSFASVGDKMLLDVLLKAPQPNPSWLGQVQLTVTMESEGIINQSLGTVLLTGLPLNATSSLSFTVPAAVRTKLLGGIAAGHFTARLSTPANAPAIQINNLRFAGNLVRRAPTAPRRSSLPDMLSFESAGDWSATGATLALVHDPVTAGAGALRVHRTATSTPVRSADFFTSELGALGASLAVDVLVPAIAWGDIVVQASCPSGTTQSIGLLPLAGRPAGSFSTFTFPIPAGAAAALSAKDQACMLTLTIDGPSGSDFVLDHLRLN